MTTTDIGTLTLHGAIAALRTRELSADELVRAMLQRVVETEPALHDWVEIFPDVLNQAAIADRRFSVRGDPPALLGIPLGVKDIFDLAGTPTRCNAALRDEAPPAVRDAEAVHRLRRDGAILLGKTVTQEFAAGVVSAPARNPWDPDRIPGGSSGGSAAAVAAGTCLGALGSDTGGSIRIPASVTGVTGLKPTWGQISADGVFPLSASLDTVGPIARTVLDAAILYLSLANRTAQIPATVTCLESCQRLDGVRIGIFSGWFDERMQPGVAHAFDEALSALRKLGADLVSVEWPEASAARAAAMLISRIESAALHREALRTSPELMGEALRGRLETGAILTGDDYLRARQARVGVARSIAALYREHRLAATVAPTLPATAPRADDLRVAYGDGATDEVGVAFTRFTMPFNATGQPVISVPCGFDDDHLPIGLSFIGRPHAELDLCALAHAYEHATGWWQHRPPITAEDFSGEGEQ